VLRQRAAIPAREFAALRDGSIDLAVGSTLNWSTSVKSLNLFALPFFFGDSTALDAVLNSEVGTRLLRSIEEAGVVPFPGATTIFARCPARIAHWEAGGSGRIAYPRERAANVEETLAALGGTPVRDNVDRCAEGDAGRLAPRPGDDPCRVCRRPRRTRSDRST
jgi:hypothetical protein